jgi:hypothetical protein
MTAEIPSAARNLETSGIMAGRVVRPERIELPTSWFVAMHSIQLSYGRIRWNCVFEL